MKANLEIFRSGGRAYLRLDRTRNPRMDVLMDSYHSDVPDAVEITWLDGKKAGLPVGFFSESYIFCPLDRVIHRGVFDRPEKVSL